MKTLAALLTAIFFSMSAAYGAEASKAEGKRPPAKQTQKVLKPGERFAATKKYISEKASKTAEIIKINAAKIKETVWPDPRPAAKAGKTDEKTARKAANGQPARRDSP